jgi:hypothetical protein
VSLKKPQTAPENHISKTDGTRWRISHGTHLKKEHFMQNSADNRVSDLMGEIQVTSVSTCRQRERAARINSDGSSPRNLFEKFILSNKCGEIVPYQDNRVCWLLTDSKGRV